jgi:hypothetical protein
MFEAIMSFFSVCVFCNKKKNLIKIIPQLNFIHIYYHQNCLDKIINNPEEFEKIDKDRQMHAINTIREINVEKQKEQERIKTIQEQAKIYKELSKQSEETPEEAVEKFQTFENNKFREIFK